MNLDFFERNNSLSKNNNFKDKNFIGDFVKELSNYLSQTIEKNNKLENATYCVASEPNDKGEVYVVIQNGTGAGKDFKLSELPTGSQYGTILRYRNGKFTIDENLSTESISSWERAKEESKKEVAHYKMENADYLIRGVYEDDIEVINNETGHIFGLSKFEFWEKDFNNLKEGMILNYKDGEYIIKE